MKKLRPLVTKVIDIIKRPYMRILPGQLAFFTLMSLIPLFALLGSIANYFSLSLDSIHNITSYLLPVDLANLFTQGSIAGAKGLNFNILIFFFAAFILASNGMHSVIVTANEIYNYKDEGFIARRIKAIAMTFVLVALLLFLLAVIVLGDFFADLIYSYAKNKALAGVLSSIFKYSKIPLSIVVIYLNVRSLYRMAPDNKTSNMVTKYAAIFTTVVWSIGTEIYAIYVKFFSNYNLFYGSVSNILILMIWLYFLAYIFVMGMALSTINPDEIIKEMDKIDKEEKK